MNFPPAARACGRREWADARNAEKVKYWKYQINQQSRDSESNKSNDCRGAMIKSPAAVALYYFTYYKSVLSEIGNSGK